MIRIRKGKNQTLQMKGSRNSSFSRKIETPNVQFSYTPLLLHVISCCACMLIGHRLSQEGIFVFFKGIRQHHGSIHSNNISPRSSETSKPIHGYFSEDSHSAAIAKHLLYLEKMRTRGGSWSAGNAAGGGSNGTRGSRAARHGILIRDNPHPNSSDLVLSQQLLFTLQEYQRWSRSPLVNERALLIITPTFARSFQKLHMVNLINSLKSITVPLLWIVIEYEKKTEETAFILSNSELTCVHLLYQSSSSTSSSSLSTYKWHDRMQLEARMREVGLNYIRENWIHGIIVFADDSSIFHHSFFTEVQKVKVFASLPVGILLQAGFEKQFTYLKKSPKPGYPNLGSAAQSSKPNQRSLLSNPNLSNSSFTNLVVTANHSEAAHNASDIMFQTDYGVLNRKIMHSGAGSGDSLRSLLQSFVSVQSPVCSDNRTLIGWHTVPHTPAEVAKGILGYEYDTVDGSAERAQMVWTSFVFDSRLVWKSPKQPGWFRSKRKHRFLLASGLGSGMERGESWQRPEWVRDWKEWAGDSQTWHAGSEKTRRLENEGLINRMIIDESNIEALGNCGKKVMAWWSRVEARGDSKHPHNWIINPKLPITVLSKHTPFNFTSIIKSKSSNSTDSSNSGEEATFNQVSGSSNVKGKSKRRRMKEEMQPKKSKRSKMKKEKNNLVEFSLNENLNQAKKKRVSKYRNKKAD